MNYNRVILGGHIVRDPEMRSTQGGKSVTSFSLAVNHGRGDKQTTCFVDCTAWEKTGELVSAHFKKGDPILIEGRLALDRWDDKEGNKRQKHSVVVDRIEFVGSKKDKGAAEAAPESALPW